MGRSRMFGSDDPADVGTPSPRTTIVGGRPPERRAGLPAVPTGIQQLLRLASVDPAFRARLVERRGDVAAAAGVILTANEAAVLAAIPAVQLEAMAAHLPPPAPPRRDLLRRTAATAVVLLGGAVLSDTGCKPAPQGTEGVPPATTAEASTGESDAAGDALAAADPEAAIPSPVLMIGGLMAVDAGAQDVEPAPADEGAASAPDAETIPEPVIPCGGCTVGDAGTPEAVVRPDAQSVSRGISVDTPPPRPDIRMQAPGGANPDMPPLRREPR